MINKINKTNDTDILDNLFNKASVVKSLNEFDITMEQIPKN